jgi:hypothetical protein
VCLRVPTYVSQQGVLIRGAEAEAETPKKPGEKSGDTRQLQPGQGWRIEAARRRMFTALKKITEATNRETTEKLRPVCLLPTIGKVYDKILATRLTYHQEVKGRLSDRQFGFRKGRGTIEAIDKAVESLRKAKTESKHAIMVALDIKNAFNSAWYPALVQLLARSGCPGDLGRAIADFLQDRSVTSEGVTVRTSRGCPQGSCLGPILWLLIMEDLFAGMDEVRAGEDVTVEVQAFADDQLVLISASSLAKLEAAWDKTWAACQL